MPSRTAAHMSSRKKKPLTPATTRQTAGPGFTFEDLVAAWLMIRLLTGEELPAVGTAGHTIQSQTGALKWQIDDLLVTAGSGSDARHLALSCKSSIQVSRNGLPADFVERVWQQWREPDSPMRRETDVLALVTRNRHPAFSAAWTDICNWCSGSDAKLAMARINATMKHTRIFESIKAPRGTQVATDEETVTLIRHLAVIPLDFQLERSTSVEEAIGKCRPLLQSGDRTEAEGVWTSLQQMATENRVGSSTLTLDEIWTKLRARYSLKDQPSFSGSWDALRALTQDYKATIDTALPSGLAIDRREDRIRIAGSVRGQPITVVFGASGSGKSALVKTTLDGDFPTFNQVWLGPEQADTATSELARSRLGLAHPLHDVLQSSGSPKNVLVLDSAERLSADVLPRIKLLIQRLVPAAVSASELPWHVVILSQTEGWSDRLQLMIPVAVERPVEVGGISVQDVKSALNQSQDLYWLTARDEAVTALKNLRILGWVIQASSMFKLASLEATSPPAIADRVWHFWTEGKAACQRLLMLLAEKDAQFVRSLPLTDLSSADALVFENKPAQMPLRKNKYNRIEFEHDLAADWARFQRLKELSGEIKRWAAFADNPLWNNALRLYGQFLLREPEGTTTAWDHAFSSLEAMEEKLSADIMLDALSLDPQAEHFLENRTVLFFANHGKLLNRLLRRFLHVATFPSAPEELRNVDRALALYVEARYRTPVYGLWPPLARFLHAHPKQVTELVSPTVSQLCEVWLTTTPSHLLSGTPMPFRKEFADTALATARALQIEQGSGTICCPGEGKRRIYGAAFAGGLDLPDEVATWALEMAQRRPQAEEIARKIADAREKAAADRAERMRSDPEFRAAQEEYARRRSAIPTYLPSSRKLPPWPLGPKKCVERDFQEVVLHAPALKPLMEVRPELAAEILLAVLIEGEPRDEYSETMRFEKVGLQYDGGDSYPTAFWKSPFFTFLQIAPNVALAALIRLVNFATERWAYQWKRGRNGKPPQITLIMRDGSKKSYVGNGCVFDWTQANSNFIGQLHCALNALERWLTLELENGVSVQPVLDRILKDGCSLAFVGLLVNVAKYRPALLSGTLLPVLSSKDVYRLDEGRVENARHNFLSFEWSRASEAIFNMARDWANAPYRQQNLVQVAAQLLPRDKAVASFLKAVIATWGEPNAPEEDIRSAILCAQLDEANYCLRVDPESGEETVEFQCPEPIKKAAIAYQQAAAPELQKILLASQCEQVLQGRAVLAEKGAAFLAQVLVAGPTTGDPDGEGHRERNRLAAAATLIACTKEWLQTHPDIGEAARIELRAAACRIGETAEELRRPRPADLDEKLKFAAYGVFDLWLHGGDDEAEWEAAVLHILTSGDDRAVAVLGYLAYRHRAELGERWWRLLELGVLWSALSRLRPNVGDAPDIAQRWQRWVRWFRSRRISGVSSDLTSVDLLSTWQRLKRLERARWRRAYERNQSNFVPSLDERSSLGLAVGFLDSLFEWLLADTARPEGQDLEIGRQILLALWSYKAAYCFEHRDEHGEYLLPYQFGYNILAKLAFYAAHVPADRVPAIWRSVLEQGPGARRLIEHFIRCWFMQLNRGCDPSAFCRVWRGMIEFALDAKWAKGGYWLDEQRVMQRLLGFDAEDSLAALPDAAQTVLGMCDLYQRWAQRNLQVDEDNVAALSRFLTSEAGAALRLYGLKWLAACFRNARREQYWRDQGGTGEALVNLLDTTLQENMRVISADQECLDALVALVAQLVTRQVPAALALQERIKYLK